MEPKRPTAAERERERREAMAHRRKTSVRLGSLGVIVLFAAGLGVWLSPGNAAPLIGVMAAGLALLGIAFLLIRTPIAELLRMPPSE